MEAIAEKDKVPEIKPIGAVITSPRTPHFSEVRRNVGRIGMRMGIVGVKRTSTRMADQKARILRVWPPVECEQAPDADMSEELRGHGSPRVAAIERSLSDKQAGR